MANACHALLTPSTMESTASATATLILGASEEPSACGTTILILVAAKQDIFWSTESVLRPTDFDDG